MQCQTTERRMGVGGTSVEPEVVLSARRRRRQEHSVGRVCGWNAWVSVAPALRYVPLPSTAASVPRTLLRLGWEPPRQPCLYDDSSSAYLWVLFLET